MSAAATTEIAVRELTDAEVAHYLEHGWVKLERLVAPEVAAQMLEAAGHRVGADATIPSDVLELLVGPAKNGEEPFRSVVFSELMGKNAQRLFNRRRLNDDDVAVRYRQDLLLCKRAGGKPTPYHQDWFAHSPDRGGEMMFWLALDEVAPEMGTMSFLSGSHREGPLGADIGGRQIIDVYPKLMELYEASPYMQYQPGDATVHSSFTIHGTPANTSERSRFGYIFMYSPADTRYFKGDVKGEIRDGEERMTLGDDWFGSPVVYGG
jgi:hypothetical protein